MASYRELFFVILAGVQKFSFGQNAVNFSPTITLNQGQLRGVEERSIDGKPFFSFYGIPFAKPPVGALRFEEPVEHDKWEGVLEATQMPSQCLQVDPYLTANQPGALPSGSEDCLYLNVFTPMPIYSSSLSVMVFIHGGAFGFASASLHLPYVLLNEDIVLVVIQYRLGIFGFLSTEDSILPGNMGLKDQRMALQWVQRNIRRFGGNRRKVTIFGESAGAASVHLQMLSPGSKDLFYGVIAQSGSALSPWSVGENHRFYAQELGNKVGCPLGENTNEFKTCLQSLEALPFYGTSLSQYNWGIFQLGNLPRVDDVFLPDYPVSLIKTGRYNKVNLLMGMNRDEGAAVLALLYLYPAWRQNLIANFTTVAPISLLLENENNAATLSTTIYDHYLQGKALEPIPNDELVQLYSDSLIKIGTDYSTLLHAQDRTIKMYIYELEYQGQRSLLDLFQLPIPKYISHFDDLLYLFSGGIYFSNLPLVSAQDRNFRRMMTKMWTNFAKYGDPTPYGDFNFDWSPATASRFGHLNLTQIPVMMNYNREEALRFWLSLDISLNRIATKPYGVL